MGGMGETEAVGTIPAVEKLAHFSGSGFWEDEEWRRVGPKSGMWTDSTFGRQSGIHSIDWRDRRRFTRRNGRR